MPRHKSKINADQRKAQPTKTSVAPSTLYDVEMVPSAAIVYKNLYEKMKRADAKGEQSSSHHTVFRMVRDAIKNIIPRDPLNKNYALTGPLAGYFRIKKGRHRICWAASSTARKICIVFISETLRKEGDANDPYEIFTKLVLSGGFDKFLGHMGIPKPPRNFSAGVPQIQWLLSRDCLGNPSGDLIRIGLGSSFLFGCLFLGFFLRHGLIMP